jgi:hypothetical protein
MTRYILLAFAAGLILSSFCGCAIKKEFRLEISHKDSCVAIDTRGF